MRIAIVENEDRKDLEKQRVFKSL